MCAADSDHGADATHRAGTPRGLRVAAALVAVTVMACSPRDAVTARRFQLAGTVAGHESGSGRVVVEHDAVQGLMPAMRMPFEIKGTGPALRDGDRISATLVMTDSRSWLEDVTITAAAAVGAPGAAAAAHAVPGVRVPPLPLSITLDARSPCRTFPGGF